MSASRNCGTVVFGVRERQRADELQKVDDDKCVAGRQSMSESSESITLYSVMSLERDGGARARVREPCAALMRNRSRCGQLRLSHQQRIVWTIINFNITKKMDAICVCALLG